VPRFSLTRPKLCFADQRRMRGGPPDRSFSGPVAFSAVFQFAAGVRWRGKPSVATVGQSWRQPPANDGKAAQNGLRERPHGLPSVAANMRTDRTTPPGTLCVEAGLLAHGSVLQSGPSQGEWTPVALMDRRSPLTVAGAASGFAPASLFSSAPKRRHGEPQRPTYRRAPAAPCQVGHKHIFI